MHVQSIEDNRGGLVGEYLFSVVETVRLSP